MDQDKIFEEYEGDNWFKRNAEALKPHDDNIIFLLEYYKLLASGKKVLEIGASNGYRLARIYEKWGCDVSAVDPSQEAYNDCKRRYPFIKFKLSTTKDLNYDENFEIVIVNSVLHWVDRNYLLLSASKIDRSLKNGGALIIGDFQTPIPIKRRYHHLKDQEVFTYKQRYSDIFLSSGSFYELASLTFNHDERSTTNITLNNMHVISLLKKERLYQEV